MLADTHQPLATSRPRGSVVCRECGHRFLALCGHLRSHNMTADEYREKYPDAATVCAEIHEKQVEAGHRFGKGGVGRKGPRITFATTVGRAPQNLGTDTSTALDPEVNPTVQGIHGLIVER